MSYFRKYIFPALYGLLVYFTVRLLHDIDVDARFWKRDVYLNVLEMACSVLVGYLSIYLFKQLFKHYDKQWSNQFNYQRVVKELCFVILANLVLVNLIFTPMAALTDDGLSWADVADLNMIPTLYAIIYYGIARSNQWLKAYIEQQVQLERIKNDHLQTELKFLRAQYHPHFLFNVLNTVYFQMDDNIEEAKASIEKFSSLLRYQLYDQQQQVPVAQEMDYLLSYVELQKVRTNTQLKLELEIASELKQQLVYPLLFMPLVENAFKYVGGDYVIRISANFESGKINFKVENSLPQQLPAMKQGGIGLENLNRRLDLLYPKNHVLTCEQTADTYFATMSLPALQ